MGATIPIYTNGFSKKAAIFFILEFKEKCKKLFYNEVDFTKLIVYNNRRRER